MKKEIFILLYCSLLSAGQAPETPAQFNVNFYLTNQQDATHKTKNTTIQETQASTIAPEPENKDRQQKSFVDKYQGYLMFGGFIVNVIAVSYGAKFPFPRQ